MIIILKFKDFNKTKKIFILIILYILSKLLIITFVLQTKISFFNIIGGYDSRFYIYISKFGYVQENLFSFFPLYPMFIKLFSGLLVHVNILYIGFILNMIFNIVSVIYLNKLSGKRYLFVIAMFLFNPISYFFFVDYTESLFFMLSIVGYYYYTVKEYSKSAIFIGLTALTKNSGYIIIILMILFANKWKNKLKFASISGIIAILYPLYLFIVNHNIFTFISSQKYFGRNFNVNFLYPIYKDILLIFKTHQYIMQIIIIFTLIIIAYTIYLIIIGIKNKQYFLSSVLLICMIYPLMYSHTNAGAMWRMTQSEARYILGLFPIYILNSYIINNKQKYVALSIFLILNLIVIYTMTVTGIYID